MRILNILDLNKSSFGGDKILQFVTDAEGFLHTGTLIQDPTGSVFGLSHIDNKLRVTSTSYTYDIAAGRIPDHSSFFKFGINPDIGTSEETIWTEGGLYDWNSIDAAAGIVKVSSSSNNDASGSTGALTCRIYGLSTVGLDQNELINLTGQTPVNSILEYSRVNRIIVESAGSNNKNVGKIYAGTGNVAVGVPDIKWAVVDVGRNQTLMSVYTVPSNVNLYITQFLVSSNSNKGNEVDMYFRPPGKVFQIKNLNYLFSNSISYKFDFPLLLESGTDIDCRAVGTATGASISFSFEGWYESVT